MSFARACLIALPAAIGCCGTVRAADDCAKIPASAIEQEWNHYASLPGVAPNGGGEKFECIAIESTKQIVCRTTAANAAHPSIVIRTIVDDGDVVSIRTEADTAGDCIAFSKMMAEFRNLDERIKQSMSKPNR